MLDFKHTQGKWRVEIDDSIFQTQYAQIVNDKDKVIANVLIDRENKESALKSFRLADIIASAPKQQEKIDYLVEALKRCIVDAEQNLTKTERLKRIEATKKVIKIAES